MTHPFRRVVGPVARTLAMLLGALALGMILAACGGDDKDDPTAEPTQPTTTDNFAQTSLSRGQAAPEFSLPTSDGSTVSLSDYTGTKQPVLLFFHMAGG